MGFVREEVASGDFESRSRFDTGPGDTFGDVAGRLIPTRESRVAESISRVTEATPSSVEPRFVSSSSDGARVRLKRMPDPRPMPRGDGPTPAEAHPPTRPPGPIPGSGHRVWRGIRPANHRTSRSHRPFGEKNELHRTSQGCASSKPAVAEGARRSPRPRGCPSGCKTPTHPLIPQHLLSRVGNSLMNSHDGRPAATVVLFCPESSRKCAQIADSTTIRQHNDRTTRHAADKPRHESAR